MAKVLVTEDYLSAIGNAIRGKLGGSTQYTPGQMASAISSIPTVAPTLVSKSISANGTYNANEDNADGYDSVSVNVPNSYSAQDEGKVVNNGTLVTQESQSVSQNGTYNTTLKNQVVVSVPNTYEVSDNGKVVVNQALVAQTSKNIDTNGTYDTTLNDSVVVNVSGGGVTGKPFIESQGTTYIDTLIPGNSIYGIEIEFVPLRCIKNYQAYFECTNNVFTIASMDINSGITSGFIRCGNTDFGIVTFLKGQINKINCKNGKVEINGTELSGSYSGAINTNNTSLRLFGSSNRSHSRIYKCKLYDVNGDVMYDLIPYEDSNNTPCLYDKLSDSILNGSENSALTYGYSDSSWV